MNPRHEPIIMQDLSCTYLAHHELENNFIIIIIIVMRSLTAQSDHAASGVKAASSSVRKGTTKMPGKEDILAQLEAQRIKQAEQLKVEARARQELEDMLLRIERHFKVSADFGVKCGCCMI